MPSCIQCGSEIPDDQGSRTCSMCYGDPFHGKDNYYLDWLEQAETERYHQELEDAQKRGEGEGGDGNE